MERYQRHLAEYRQANGKPLSVHHQVSKLHSIQGLFRWLVRGHHLASNPAADLTLPRVPQRRLPEPLTPEEIETALATLDVELPIELRDRAIWELLYSTGLRRFEALSLQLGDVDHSRGTVFVRQGKGRKDRLVPIGERALAWLDKYLDEVRAVWANADQSTLFVNPDGGPITAATLSHRARGLLDRAGITKPGACHLFRHSMATQMLEHGADVRYVQEMLGHAHLNTTQIYTHVSIGKLKAVHAATHPAAKLARRTSVAGEGSDTDGGG
jgi:integrase/recombinase XerD